MSWRPLFREKLPRKAKKRLDRWRDRLIVDAFLAKLERMAEFNRKTWAMLREASGLEP